MSFLCYPNHGFKKCKIISFYQADLFERFERQSVGVLHIKRHIIAFTKVSVAYWPRLQATKTHSRCFGLNGLMVDEAFLRATVNVVIEVDCLDKQTNLEGFEFQTPRISGKDKGR